MSKGGIYCECHLCLRSELTARSLAGMEKVNEAPAVARHDELHHLRTLPALLPLPEQDVSKVLMNLPDNAVEAASLWPAPLWNCPRRNKTQQKAR